METKVKIGDVVLSCPVLPASGCFGYGIELAQHYDLSALGGIVSKAVTLEERLGNDMPRIAETPSGMLNAIGLENPGVEFFLDVLLAQIKRFNLPIIVNLAGNEPTDYVELAEKMQDPQIVALELNLSCPNVKSGCMSIGTNPQEIERVVSAVRRATEKPIWVKLTPNVTDITEMALAAEAAGADAISLINTLLAMVVDVKTRRPLLKNNTGGLSGPAVMPVALRMVSECYRVIDIPIIGMGGIASVEDALAFLMAGASAVQIGSSAMQNPGLLFSMKDEMCTMAHDLGFSSLSEITGCLEYWN
ncbi:MAG: dihydroorotate dehydrogenase [Eubacteriales bacterium]|nr:dihydroorotate dehydrogenase [Eubacteriales bacterium]MDD4323724.1 dihydroorotate dehydrogenase [Eubacteriales bacterium]MDD4541954.1 dihydroorotate dehydrogenase [Eubacteriales bacterium]